MLNKFYMLRVFFALPMTFFLAVTVAQECEIDIWVQENYYYDAKYLSVREMVADELHPYHDSVYVPDSLTNKYLKLISQVYDLESEYSNYIFKEEQIHVLTGIPANIVILSVGKDAEWIESYINDSLISGHEELDSLLFEYEFVLDFHYELSEYHIINVQSKKEDVMNLDALKDEFTAVEGIDNFSYNDYFLGQHSISFSDDEVLTFEQGWGDCPAGCIYNHWWRYTFEGCAIISEESGGDPFVALKNIENTDIHIYPNPASREISIAGDHFDLFEIYSVSGVLVKLGRISDQKINVSGISGGLYILYLQNREGVYSTKIRVN